MTTTEILTGIKNWVVGKLNLKQNVISDLANIRSGAQAGATSVQPADILSYFDNAVYDSGTHRINFYHGQSVIAYVDASPFIVDGMVNDVRIENGYLVIDFNTDSGKQDISIPLTDIFDPSNYYNKTQTDTLLSNKVDKVSGKGLSTNDYTNAEKEKLSGLQNYDDTQVRQLIAQKQDVIQDLANIRSGAQAGATAVQSTTLNSALSNTVAESGVYDVTANNNNAKFADLSALLNSQDLNTLIPTDIRKGGMSVKFVLSSDNKYVQYRLMHPLDNASTATADFTNVANWQGVDEEPIDGSKNLVESGGIKTELDKKVDGRQDSKAFYVTDDNGYIIAKIDKDGVHSVDFKIGEEGDSVANALGNIATQISDAVNTEKLLREQGDATIIGLVTAEENRAKAVESTKLDAVLNANAFYFTDANGYIIAKIDANGVHSVNIEEEPNKIDNDSISIEDSNGYIIARIDRDGIHSAKDKHAVACMVLSESYYPTAAPTRDSDGNVTYAQVMFETGIAGSISITYTNGNSSSVAVVYGDYNYTIIINRDSDGNVETVNIQ